MALAVNGEIYNHRALEAGLAEPYAFQTGSDCEVILALYEQRGTGSPNDLSGFLNDLYGIFAFALYDQRRGRYLIARDPIGVMPLYMGHDEEGRFYVASEMKALEGTCKSLREFPARALPGQRGWRAAALLQADLGRLRRRRRDAARAGEAAPGARGRGAAPADERRALRRAAVGRPRLVADRALARRHSERRVEDDERSEAWWPRLHSFAIGLEGSPDLEAARIAAEHIGTVHHGFHFTVQEGIDALTDVIYHLETFDVTTVRAATPMYLMARRIKAMGIKMVFTGEGADEIFGGYLYFHKAPDARELHAETVRKLDQLHLFDCLRANKSMAAWGIEARVPFLDREFLDVAMGFDPEEKMAKDGRIEKHVLRSAFEGYLPDEILWRQKEQFSDGVGYSWIDSLKEHAEREVSDDQLARARFRFAVNPPATKEAYLYRSLFEAHFPSDAAARCVPEGPSIACSTPTAIAWDAAWAESADPSGRAVRGVHKEAL